MEVLSKEERLIQEKREERGLLKASSFLNNEIGKLVKKNEPLRVELIIKAHKSLFNSMGGEDASIGGKFRKSNGPELERIDGTPLKISDYKNIANDIAILDEELKTKTRNLRRPSKKSQFKNIIWLAARLSHRFATIHPFENGNGRASRLLLSAILKRTGLYWLDSDASVNSKKREKDKYRSAMRQADDGYYEMLEKIIGQSIQQTVKKLYGQRRRMRV